MSRASKKSSVTSIDRNEIEHLYFTIAELERLTEAVHSMDDKSSTHLTSHHQRHQSMEELQPTLRSPIEERSEIRTQSWHHEYWSCEQSIIGARASVMVYDDTQRKWIPSGTSSGLSKVQIYHHQQNNTFRVVGRKLQDHEVVINCAILKGLKYNQATATFHQWRDSKFVYGLNFSSPQDAEAFARAMTHALDVLSGRVIPQTQPPPTNGNGLVYDEDMGYRTMTREDAAMIQQQQITTSTGSVAATPQTPTSQTATHPNHQIPQSPPTPQTHHRTSSAPPAPQPPPMSMASQQQQQQQPTGFGIMPQQPPYQHNQHPVTQQPPAYTTQLSQGSYGSNQNMSQFNQPIYVSSSSNQSLNQQAQQPPQPPPMQQQQQQSQQPPQPSHNQNGGPPIYVPSNVSVGLPSSASNNSVYNSNLPPLQQKPITSAPIYVQSNGLVSSGPTGTVGSGVCPPPTQYGQVPVPPQMPGATIIPVVGGPPQAPPPPPAFNGGLTNGPAAIGSQSGMGQTNGPPGPPPPMMINNGPATGSSVAPPPPPPPPIGGLTSDGRMDMSSLAAQLQQAKLKRNAKLSQPAPVTENSGSSTSSGGSGNYGTIGRSSNGMASMMDEMAKTLARRRALTEKKPEEMNDDPTRRPWEKSSTLPHKLNASGSTSNQLGANSPSSVGGGSSGSESPRPSRKRFGSASEETILKQVNGENGTGNGLSIANPQELETLKADILREMRIEIRKAKQEIIDAIKVEINRR